MVFNLWILFEIYDVVLKVICYMFLCIIYTGIFSLEIIIYVLGYFLNIIILLENININVIRKLLLNVYIID